MRACALLLIVLSLARGTFAAEAPIPPAPANFMTDEAGLLSAETRARLEPCLRDLRDRTGRQVLVYIGRSLGGVPIENFAVRAFEQWGVGRRGHDDGLVVFVFPEDRAIRIEVGYGLEGEITDASSSSVISDVMAPELRAGRPDAAIEGAVASLLQLMGEPACAGVQAAMRSGPASAELTLAQKILIGLMLAALLVFVVTHPRAALWLLVQLVSSRRGGYGWQGIGGSGGSSGGGTFGGGGGGFSGGGGRSGGGGASGGW